jgi:hypothetical protein
VKSLGGDGSTTPSARTADQTQIAYFWWESSPLKWSRIARTASANSGFSPWQNARLFGHARAVLESMDAIKLDAVVYPSWNNPPH